MNIQKVETDIFVSGIVRGEQRPGVGTYGVSVAGSQINCTVSERHLNRGTPLAKRTFRINCNHDTGRLFQTIQDAISDGLSELKMASDEIEIVVRVESVRKEMRVFAEGEASSSGSQRADLIVDGSCIGTVFIYVPDTTAFSFEAIITKIDTQAEGRLFSALECDLPCVIQLQTGGGVT